MAARYVERADYPRLAGVIFSLDTHLRRHHAVFEFTRNPLCIFRMQLRPLDQAFVLSDGTRFRKGARVLDLHLWNEQIPRLHTSSLGWARVMRNRLDLSLRELARYLSGRSDLADVVVIRANMSFGTAQQSAQLARIAARYGFEPVLDPRPGSIFRPIHKLGENILISLMVLARNTTALRRDSLWRDRTQTFLSRDILEQRYGGCSVELPPSRRDG